MGLNLKQLFQNEYSFEETINENFFKVDMFSQSFVFDRITSSTDNNIINNKLYLITKNTDTLFSDKINQLVCYNANLGWLFYTPQVGKLIFLQKDNKYYFFDGNEWEIFDVGNIHHQYENIEADLSTCLLKENNLLDIEDKTLACHNLGTLSETELNSSFLRKDNNLSGIINTISACHNIGTLTEQEMQSTFLSKNKNLLDITNQDQACHNIGTLTEREMQSTFFCKSKNLLDITDQDQACHNIGTLRDWEIRRVGDYKMSAQKQDHDNWFICDGREVLRSAYPELFNVISTDFGAGNGTTTFNIPNFKNRVPWGANGNLNSTINSGLPNITGYYRAGGNVPITNVKTDLTTATPTITSGCLSISMEQTTIMLSTLSGSSVKPKVMNFDASKSNAIYGNSTIVQPPAICVNVFILMK